MINVSKNLIKIIILIICYINYIYTNNCFASNNTNNAIGIISLLPSPLGIFYNNRIIKNYKSEYLGKQNKIDRNISNEISIKLTDILKKEFPDIIFKALPSLPPEQYLTGYLIEGIWGDDTKSVSIKNIQRLFIQHNLDEIIAVVPVTYYLPFIQAEASGINLSIIKDKITFSATYSILIFSKNSQNTYEKKFSSIKQVFEKTKVIPNEKEYLNIFYQLFDNEFFPYLANQFTQILKDKNNKKAFPRPKSPLYYLLPH